MDLQVKKAFKEGKWKMENGKSEAAENIPFSADPFPFLFLISYFDPTPPHIPGAKFPKA